MAQQTWFITGVNSGFGRQMTEKLLERGDRVAGTARNLAQLDDLKAQYGDRLWLGRLDLTDTPVIRRTVDEAFAALGHIHVVVNNAGYAVFGAGEEATGDQIRHIIDTNLIGSMEIIRAALPHLRAQGGGRILQVSSTGGQYAFPNFSLYHATKWGIEGFVEAVAQEVAPFGIEMTIVEPGATHTNFASGLVESPLMPAYDNTPARAVRTMAHEGKFPIPGDAAKVAQAMIDCVEVKPAPKRLPLGSDTYTLLHQAYTERLAELEASKSIAFSTDANPA